MHNRGFTIGLHFDTTAYDNTDLNKPIQSEKHILEENCMRITLNLSVSWIKSPWKNGMMMLMEVFIKCI